MDDRKQRRKRRRTRGWFARAWTTGKKRMVGTEDGWHLNGDVLYAELLRQNDSNWKAVSASRTKRQKLLKGKYIRSLLLVAQPRPSLPLSFDTFLDRTHDLYFLPRLYIHCTLSHTQKRPLHCLRFLFPFVSAPRCTAFSIIYSSLPLAAPAPRATSFALDFYTTILETSR